MQLRLLHLMPALVAILVAHPPPANAAEIATPEETPSASSPPAVEPIPAKSDLKRLVGMRDYYDKTELQEDQLSFAAEVTKRPPNCPAEMSCGQCRLLNAAKDMVRERYQNRPRGHGDCGGAVGDFILKAGFPFIKRPAEDAEKPFNRYAIDYLKTLPALGWKRLNITDPQKAPPGAVLVFTGPCSQGVSGHGQPAKKRGCNGSAGNRVGHVTVMSDEKIDPDEDARYTLTDGKTERPAVGNRYLAGVFVPGPAQNELCGGK